MLVLWAFSPAIKVKIGLNRPFLRLPPLPTVRTRKSTSTNTTTMARISAISRNWRPILAPQHTESFTNTTTDTAMAQSRRLECTGQRHTTHNTTHHGESPWWWQLWWWFSAQWGNITPAPPRSDWVVSWLGIISGEWRRWCNIGGVQAVGFQWLIWYMVLFSTNSIVCCACKNISSGVINIMQVLSMTNSRVLFRMVYSDLYENIEN